jgi:NADH-quinone oxidoreductase subunit H
VFASAFAAFVVIPFSPRLIVSDLNIGILYLIAISSLVVIGIMMAGWSSNNKWALYGAIRSAAQIVSYEIPAGFALLTSVMLVGSLSMQDIAQAQAGGIRHWFIFHNPFSFVAFFIYYCASLAEVNRTPFDIPEAESELVAGYHTEYTGMRFAIFFLAEYANMFAVSAIATTLFLGAWNGILPTPILPPALAFILKCLFLIFIMMWLRWTLPRLRVDQLMYMSWKVLLPFSALCVVGVGLWIVVSG